MRPSDVCFWQCTAFVISLCVCRRVWFRSRENIESQFDEAGMATANMILLISTVHDSATDAITPSYCALLNGALCKPKYISAAPSQCHGRARLQRNYRARTRMAAIDKQALALLSRHFSEHIVNYRGYCHTCSSERLDVIIRGHVIISWLLATGAAQQSIAFRKTFSFEIAVNSVCSYTFLSTGFLETTRP